MIAFVKHFRVAVSCQLLAAFLLPVTLSGTQLDLEWIDTASGETSYTVQWSELSNYSVLTGSAVLAANVESYSITGLDSNTLYYVRVFCSNAKGDSDNLDGSGTTVPAAPISLSGAQGDGSKIDLTWTAPSGGASSYKVEYKRTVDSTWTEFASGVAGTLDTVTGLDGTTSYDFRVRGTSAGGDGSYSNVDTITTGTAAPPLLAETFEGSESVTGGTGTADNTGWSANNVAVNFNYTSNPIAGSNSLQVIGSTREATHSITPAGDEVWIYFRIKGAVESTFPVPVLTLEDGSSNECMKINVRSNYEEIYIRHGTVDEISAINNWPGSDVDVSVERHVRIQWIKGTGSDGIMRLWTSSDGSFSLTADREITTGDGNYTPASVTLYGGSDAIIDSLLISDDEIGSNPSI